jgi:hypothetical protein
VSLDDEGPQAARNTVAAPAATSAHIRLLFFVLLRTVEVMTISLLEGLVQHLNEIQVPGRPLSGQARNSYSIFADFAVALFFAGAACRSR